MFFCLYSIAQENEKYASLDRRKEKNVDSIDVLNYKIELEVDFNAHEIVGKTTLQVTPAIAPMDTLVFDFSGLSIDGIVVDDAFSPDYYREGEKLYIVFSSTLSVGTIINIAVSYHGDPVIEPYNWGGFHIDPGGYAYNLGVAFEAIPHNYGRCWFPCIDNFTDRASYDFEITTNMNSKAVCSGEFLGVFDNGDGTQTWYWRLEEEIPTYLASVAIGDYEIVRDTVEGIEKDIPISLYVRPSQVSSIQASFVNLKEAISVFENKFGAYSWNRVGYVATAKGAMEHATNIAYPNSTITGNTTYETLMAHELSHSWFGNKVTCSSAEHMWLNEGWAVFCESVFIENIYGKSMAKSYLKDKHFEVLTKAHTDDGGFFALDNIPQDITYGTTVYQKGGMMVHTLRNYLGDSLFFDAATAYLEYFGFDDADSYLLRDFLSIYTNINMNSFFENWIFQPGFPQYTVDSFNIERKGMENFIIHVALQEKLFERNQYSEMNKIELAFMDNNWQSIDKMLTFDGPNGNVSVEIPFEPDFILIDRNEKIADASTDRVFVFKDTGEVSLSREYIKINPKAIQDSAIIQLRHNWVAPDEFKTPVEGLFISHSRYWQIFGMDEKIDMSGAFRYLSLSIDRDLITNDIDSLVILYRKDASQDWQIVPATIDGSQASGFIVVDELHTGEYALGIWDYDHEIPGGIEQDKIDQGSIWVYPNPSRSVFNIEWDGKTKGSINIIDESGQTVFKKDINPSEYSVVWDAEKAVPGSYIIIIKDQDQIKAQTIALVLK